MSITNGVINLPIGSVVMLYGLNRLICIMGKDVTNAQTEERYEFAGVLFPGGYIDPSECYMFNEADIEKIYAIGYLDDVSNRAPQKPNIESFDGLLPVGSVVRLKGATKYLMVVGVGQIVSGEKEEVYEYGGVVFPEGYENKDRIFVFNKDMIEEILHVGFIFDGQMQFEKDVLAMLNES